METQAVQSQEKPCVESHVPFHHINTEEREDILKEVRMETSIHRLKKQKLLTLQRETRNT